MQLLILLCALVQSDDLIDRLRNVNERIRRNAAEEAGILKVTRAVPELIPLLNPEKEKDAGIAAAAQESLRQITGKQLIGYAAWNEWWTKEGEAQYQKAVFDEKSLPEVVRKILQPSIDDVDTRIRTAKSEIRSLTVGLMVIGVVFILTMLYFVGHVSSRLKEWKELVQKAEVYIKKSEEITTRTDKITAELDSKKAEIMTFLAKSKEDSQAEFERYCDILEKNLEHKMREEVMGLRQKAEKELEQTLGELRTQVDHEIRRGANEQREKMEKEVTQRRQGLLKDLDAEKRYIEARRYLVNDHPEEALPLFKQIAAEKPDDALALHELSQVYLKLKRYEEAVETGQKALTIQPNNPRILYTLAATYARMRQRDKMMEKLSVCVANDRELKDEALNDQSFREYWSDPRFRDLCEA